jgi:steroid 5-alpha reductase family enzyme
MNILKTALLLLITLVIVPVFTYYFGTPLTDNAWMALQALIKICLVAVVYCFVVGEITGNNSQVDKLWSILPIVYVWVAAYYGDYAPRLVLMSVLVTIWGIRLTFNFARQGGYSKKFWTGKEDYRWSVLRAKPEFQPKWKWSLFNLFFISIYQQLLILMFTLPVIIAVQFREEPLGIWDFLIAGGMLFFVIFETVADQQQWNYQKEKWRRISEKEDLTERYKKGFLDEGLWAYSRHPNYFAEQSVWVCFYLFSVIASGDWFNWSIAGCLLLLVLFQGSSNFSEEISAEKYPLYKSYQASVPRFIGLRRSKK